MEPVNTPVNTPANAPANAPVVTIKTANGELYVQGDLIVGRMVIEGNVTRYYRGDKLHRDGDLPASIERNDTGVVIYEAYYRDDTYHRDGDLPAVVRRNDAGVVTYEGYYRNGKYHRDGDLPAYIRRNNDGVVTDEEYHRDGKMHRDGDLPAYIERDDAGKVMEEEYYRNGELITLAEIKLTTELEAEKATTRALREELAAANVKLATALEQLAEFKKNVLELIGQ